VRDINDRIKLKQEECKGKHGRQYNIYLVWARYKNIGNCPIITLRAVTTFKEKAELYELWILHDEKDKNLEDVWVESRVMNHCYGATMQVASKRSISI
jgi:hypothetical protein